VLERAIGRVSSWVTQQVIAASSKGEEDANAIYTEIVRRLAHLTEEKSQKKVRPNKTKLIEELGKQAQRSTKFSRYGLMAPTSIDALIGSIQSAPAKALPAIQDVLKPFINGLQARLDALRGVHDAVDAFVGTLNSFYRGKTVTFGLKSGILISGPGGEVLPPNVLSSGEKQLLLLFCNLLFAMGQDSIFMIDEPELSLNVKWQRQLTSSLLEFSRSNRTQFMLATHSIELITRYRNCVLKLAPPQNV
jgi:predicted ATPase